MRFIDPKNLETAFVKPGTPMLSDVIERLDEIAMLSPTRRRDMISGLRRVARALGRAPQEVPADPRWLQPRLAQILPAALGISQKSWVNTVSNAKSALAHADVIERRHNTIDDLMPEWWDLWRAVLDSKDPTLPRALRRFVHFLSRHAVLPADVADIHSRTFRDALAANEISKNPDVTYRTAVNGWNLAGQRIAGWPETRLTLPDRTKRIVLPIDTFPESFGRDLDAFANKRLGAADPLDLNSGSQTLSAASIRLYRGKIMRFASVLVHDGHDTKMITGLAQLVVPAHAEAGLRWLLARNDNQSSQDIAKIAALLARIGRDHVHVTPEVQARLDEMARRLKMPSPRGMTRKNRERLRTIGSPEILRRLLVLPETLTTRAGKNGRAYHDALLSEDAIAIGILLYCPIRRKNVSRIHVDHNLQRPGDGRVFLAFEPEEVKNRQRIEFELPPDLVRMIDHHLVRRAPLLCPHGTPWLFPKRTGAGPMDPDQFSGRIKQRLARELGVTMNVHLFRHLAAKIFLDANPGAYEVVRQLLGHASLSKTLAAYAGFETGTATRLFADVLTQARGK
jgi:integrase